MFEATISNTTLPSEAYISAKICLFNLFAKIKTILSTLKIGINYKIVTLLKIVTELKCFLINIANMQKMLDISKKIFNTFTSFLFCVRK